MRFERRIACSAALLLLAESVAADSLQWLTPLSSVDTLTVGEDTKIEYTVVFGGIGELQGAGFSFYEIDERPAGYNVTKRSTTKATTKAKATKHDSKTDAKKSKTSTAKASSAQSYNNTLTLAKPIATDFNVLTREQWFAENTTSKGGLASFTAISVGKLLVVVSGVEIWPCAKGESATMNLTKATSSEKDELSKVTLTNSTECGAVVEISRVFTIAPASSNATNGAVAVESEPPSSKAAAVTSSTHSTKTRTAASHHHKATHKTTTHHASSTKAHKSAEVKTKATTEKRYIEEDDSFLAKRNGSASAYLFKHQLNLSARNTETHAKRNGSASWFASLQAASQDTESLVKRNGSASQYLAQQKEAASGLVRKVRRTQPIF